MTPERIFEALRAIGPAAWFDAPGMSGAGHGAVLLMLQEDDATLHETPPAPVTRDHTRRVGPSAPGATAPLPALGRVRTNGEVAWFERTDAHPSHDDVARLLGLRPGWYAYESAPRVHAGRVCVRVPGSGAVAPSANAVSPDRALLPDVWHAGVRAAFVWPSGQTRAEGGPLVAVDAREAHAMHDVEAVCREVSARADRDHDGRGDQGGNGIVVPGQHATPEPLTALAHPTRARERYCDGVRTIQALLRAGECYQVNLARHVDVIDPRDPLVVWRRLRASNQARRALYLHTLRGAVVSNSPELLLHARGGMLRSVPIKGTSTHAPEAVAGLRRSEKERAELRMIVDLVRADLGRVAVPGSVQVGPRRVGPVGHVYHAMQAVHASLAPGMDGHDAFRALFPAGSVTGAPRLRAMEVIRDLEEVPRGVYCGSLGAWLPPEPGDARRGAWWNVAIRTVTFGQGLARVHVGAGIVMDSDPEREFHETTLKARRMLEALA